jgi:CHAT domain/SIR2-like domain
MQPRVGGYEELRLRIDRQEGASYRVLASTRSAEASASFELPFNELEIENFILKVSRPRGRRRIDRSAIDDARRFGGALFKALFRDQVYGLYHDSLAEARGQGRGVRVTLCLSGAPELIDVPWEYLFDDPDFLAVSEFTPIVRYLDLPRAHRPLLVEPPLRLLGIVSSPSEYEQLDVERERDNLERALFNLSEQGAIELQWLERPTLRALLRALQRETFHALHYIGHGMYDKDAERGVLLFEDDSGWAQPVSGDELGLVLRDFASLRLAILNACEGARSARNDPFAGVAGSLVQRDIPAVVAMQFEISDEAAIVFGGEFYERLAEGLPVDTSLSAARLAMLAERSGDIEWGTPVLFMRVPDGRIFDLGERVSDRPADQPVTAGTAGRDPDAANGSRRALSIFVNYRPDDTSGHALLVGERLGQHFGHENVRLTTNDGSVVDRQAAVGASGAFLTLIGPTWVQGLKAASSAARSEDFVRREIEWALRDRPEAVIPVLVDAVMPEPEALPRSVRGLCRRTPAHLRHATFDVDLKSLISRLEQSPDPSTRSPKPTRRGAIVSAEPKPMPLEPSTLAAAEGIPQPYRDHYVSVINGMLDGGVVPVLGPGIHGPLVPADQLETTLAQQFDAHSSGLAEVAQRIAVTLGERRLYTAIKELITARSEPTPVHRFFAELPGVLRQMELRPRYQLIISANYDTALERAFEEAGEPFDYAIYLAASGWFVHVPWGERESEPSATTILEPRTYVDFPIDDDGELGRTIIVKIHGSVDGREGGVAWRNNYVVTEDHYINYLPTENIQDHLPIQVLDKLTGSRCLFLGYALRTWDARVFLKRVWRESHITESSWAIEQEPTHLEKASWSVAGHVELLAANLHDYVEALRSMLLGWREDR